MGKACNTTFERIYTFGSSESLYIIEGYDTLQAGEEDGNNQETQ